MKVKAKIYVTQKENDKYFAQKLPTFRNGFCYIERIVTLEKDPSEVYSEGEWGYITAGKQKIFVCGSGTEFEIAV